MVPKNMHAIERPVRIILGVALFAIGGYVGSTLHWGGFALMALGFVPLLTGATGRCPAYAVVGVSTGGEE